MTMESKTNTKPIKSVARASHILEVLAQLGGKASLTQIVERTGIALTTAHRTLQALAEEGYIRQDTETRAYSLGPGLIYLGGMSGRILGSWARPELSYLVGLTGETSTLSLLNDTEVINVAQVPSNHNLKMLTELGRHTALTATASGKAMLSIMDEDEREELLARCPHDQLTRNTITDLGQLRDELKLTRERGYAVENGEQELGVRAFAVAKRTDRILAVSISGPDSRLTMATVAEHAQALIETTQSLRN